MKDTKKGQKSLVQYYQFHIYKLNICVNGMFHFLRSS